RSSLLPPRRDGGDPSFPMGCGDTALFIQSFSKRRSLGKSQRRGSRPDLTDRRGPALSTENTTGSRASSGGCPPRTRHLYLGCELRPFRGKTTSGSPG